jgi:hypothetical protein
MASWHADWVVARSEIRLAQGLRGRGEGAVVSRCESWTPTNDGARILRSS